MSTVPNQNGYLNKAKWMLVEKAPLTASGLNEVLVMAETKDTLLKIASLLGYKVTARGGYHAVKLEDATS